MNVGIFLDPRLSLTFVAVVEEKSFTRAAARLGVAQPWVSEQIRRLEAQLGTHLIRRTSREVALTRAGEAFLPHAQQLHSAYRSAQAFAEEMRRTAQQKMRLGVMDIFNGYPERRLLIDAFVQAQPKVILEIRTDGAQPLLRDIEQGELDVVLAFSTSRARSRSLEVLSLERRYGHIMIPAEDPLARKERLTLDMLHGRSIVVAPGSSDPRAVRTAFLPLAAYGVTLLAAPEPIRQTIEQIARVQRALCIRWSAIPEDPHEEAGMVCVPLEGHPLVTETALWRRRGHSHRAAAQFWEVARRLATTLSTQLAGQPFYPS